MPTSRWDLLKKKHVYAKIQEKESARFSKTPRTGAKSGFELCPNVHRSSAPWRRNMQPQKIENARRKGQRTECLKEWQRAKSGMDTETNARPSQSTQRVVQKFQRGRNGKTVAARPNDTENRSKRKEERGPPTKKCTCNSEPGPGEKEKGVEGKPHTGSAIHSRINDACNARPRTVRSTCGIPTYLSSLDPCASKNVSNHKIDLDSENHLDSGVFQNYIT